MSEESGKILADATRDNNIVLSKLERSFFPVQFFDCFLVSSCITVKTGTKEGYTACMWGWEVISSWNYANLRYFATPWTRRRLPTTVSRCSIRSELCNERVITRAIDRCSSSCKLDKLRCNKGWVKRRKFPGRCALASVLFLFPGCFCSPETQLVNIYLPEKVNVHLPETVDTYSPEKRVHIRGTVPSFRSAWKNRRSRD